jgi:Tfp pilus assembly protein PilW
MYSFNKQRGLSLIELMISITLGMTLMAAAMQFIVSTRQTYELNDDIARIQENGRIALDILSKDLKLAGYRKPLNGDGTVPNYFLNDCSIKNTDGEELCSIDNGTTNSDRLSVQFDPPPDDGSTETDCLGNALANTDSVIVNSYTIDDVDKDGINSLYCESYDVSAGTVISTLQPIVDGIDNMQVLYGIADDEVNVSRYISGEKLYTDASRASVTTDWPNIRSVRVALLVSNGSAEGFAENRLRDYRLLDSDIIQYTDQQARRIYSTTIQFNNKATQ